MNEDMKLLIKMGYKVSIEGNIYSPIYCDNRIVRVVLEKRIETNQTSVDVALKDAVRLAREDWE